MRKTTEQSIISIDEEKGNLMKAFLRCKRGTIVECIKWPAFRKLNLSFKSLDFFPSCEHSFLFLWKVDRHSDYDERENGTKPLGRPVTKRMKFSL